MPFAVQPWCRDRWAVEEGAVLALLRARSGYKLNSMLLDFHIQGSAGVIKVCLYSYRHTIKVCVSCIDNEYR